MTERFRPLDDEGLVDENDDLEDGTWELDPNDPTHPDHDLSIAHGYSNWEPQGTTLLARRTVVLGIVALIVIVLVLIPLLQVI
jgi:hypothetical protein